MFQVHDSQNVFYDVLFFWKTENCMLFMAKNDKDDCEFWFPILFR